MKKIKIKLKKFLTEKLTKKRIRNEKNKDVDIACRHVIYDTFFHK